MNKCIHTDYAAASIDKCPPRATRRNVSGMDHQSYFSGLGLHSANITGGEYRGWYLALITLDSRPRESNGDYMLQGLSLSGYW
jgi:hypothetical protein